MISRVTTWSDNQVLTATALNAEFDNILSNYNGGITNANIDPSAAIATSKISATFPSGTIVGTTDSQTLSSKTLTKPTVNGSVQAFTTDSYGSSITFDMSNSNLHTTTLAGNPTFAVSGVSVGQAFVIRIIQGGGSNTVTWFTTIKWPNSTAPTLTTTAGKIDVFGFICTSSGNYDGYIVGQSLG